MQMNVNFFATLRRVTAMAFRHRTRMLVALLATALAAAAQVAIPRLIGHAVDHATGLLASGATGQPGAREALAHVAWLLLGAAGFRGRGRTEGGGTGDRQRRSRARLRNRGRDRGRHPCPSAVGSPWPLEER